MTLEKAARITSIDLLRGIIMVIMALDHTRDFFHFDVIHNSPENLYTTSVYLFFTRWITHYCAPTFIILAGISAYLYGQRPGVNLSRFLLTRGLWLILVELIVIRYGWMSIFLSLHFVFQVIWAIGISMIFLSLIRRLPYIVILTIGLLIIFLHNLTDGIVYDGSSPLGILWTLLHVQGMVNIGAVHIYVFYPVLPYFGLISVGYCLGKLFTPSTSVQMRKRVLLFAGLSCIGLFIVLRYINIYGDPQPWSKQFEPLFTFISFIRVCKYPCSLLFILMTVGPALLFLRFFENTNNAITKIFLVFGRVPMFYYILHLYIIHFLAMAMGGNKYHLWQVYIIWLGIVTSLYFPCKWYSTYKSSHPSKWWLSYL
ncbi:MAG TPA: heparan-alpha-glucosaminide N-acetyltransferase domain-containing protein [Bacteroidia bacterium]|nr:heparan-alpha-glucosaminide N-acetyltransferase domain-containing protein [Bacteroidia bacterium]